MKTIDELRGFLSESPSVVFPDKVSEYVDAIERELEERYIEGPTDKNGDPITYNTKIYQWGALEYIACEMHPDGTYEWYVRGHDTSAPLLKASEVEAFNPIPTVNPTPTVEDVLREFTDAILEWAGESGTVAEVGTWSDVAAEFAKRLQLKERDDD